MSNSYHNRLSGKDAIHQIMWMDSTDPAIDSSNDVQARHFWMDTTGGDTLQGGAVLKQRNEANDGWTVRCDLSNVITLS